VHATGVQLHDAVGIGKTAVPHARVLGVVLHDVDPGDHGIEQIGPADQKPECLLDACARAPVLEPVAVTRGDD
jgi:hypothetical protein